MRCDVSVNKNRFVKKVEATKYLFKYISVHLPYYFKWLETAGFRTPQTDLTFQDGYIVINQERIAEKPILFSGHIVNRIKSLTFDKYGLDSNPNNFLGPGGEYFVDIFPFLVRNDHVIYQQFEYDIREVYKRYFSLENILATYSVRLFKQDYANGVQSLLYLKSYFLENFKTILPREKMRLLTALQLRDTPNSDLFLSYYAKSKRLSRISIKDNLTLESLFHNL